MGNELTASLPGEREEGLKPKRERKRTYSAHLPKVLGESLPPQPKTPPPETQKQNTSCKLLPQTWTLYGHTGTGSDMEMEDLLVVLQEQERIVSCF